MRLKEIRSQKEELTEATFMGRSQEDPALAAYIRQHEIHQPSNLPYRLSQPNRRHYSQYRQSKYAEANFLHGMVRFFSFYLFIYYSITNRGMATWDDTCCAIMEHFGISLGLVRI